MSEKEFYIFWWSLKHRERLSKNEKSTMFVKQKLIFIISIITFQHQRANGSHVEVTKAENLDFERQKVGKSDRENENFGQHSLFFFVSIHPFLSVWFASLSRRRRWVVDFNLKCSENESGKVFFREKLKGSWAHRRTLIFASTASKTQIDQPAIFSTKQFRSVVFTCRETQQIIRRVHQTWQLTNISSRIMMEIFSNRIA